MPLSAEARARLVTQQATLVSALVGRGEAPAKIDAMRFRAAAAALARKRARAVARAWPGLAQSLGKRFGSQFAAYAEGAHLPRFGGALADGRVFAHWLAVKGDLPEAGKLQALAIDLSFRRNQEGLLPRRWLTCKATWLHQSRRLIVGVCLPWLGPHWLCYRVIRGIRGPQPPTDDV